MTKVPGAGHVLRAAGHHASAEAHTTLLKADIDATCRFVDAGHEAEEDQRRALLLELYEQGLTRREIAERMGICPDWVRQLLRRYEVPALPVWERRYRRAIAERESQIVAPFMRLHSYRAVAQQLGLRATRCATAHRERRARGQRAVQSKTDLEPGLLR